MENHLLLKTRPSNILPRVSQCISDLSKNHSQLLVVGTRSVDRYAGSSFHKLAASSSTPVLRGIQRMDDLSTETSMIHFFKQFVASFSSVISRPICPFKIFKSDGISMGTQSYCWITSPNRNQESSNVKESFCSALVTVSSSSKLAHNPSISRLSLTHSIS